MPFWLPEADCAGLSSPLLSPRSTGRLAETRPDMEGFLGRAPERGETPLPAETGEANAELTEPVALKQGPMLKRDDAALALALAPAVEEESDSREDDDKSAAALTSMVRPGGHARDTGERTDGSIDWFGLAKGFNPAGQTSCGKSEESSESDVLGALSPMARLW